MFFFGQDSDASTTTSLCGSRPSYTQKAEGRCDRRSSQSAHQHCIKGYAFLDFLKFWKPEYSHFFCRVVCCMKWHLPPVEEWGRSGDLCESLIGRTNWHAVLVYVFCLSLVFSLNMHPRTCLLWMCALLPFHLISSLPWLWIIRTQKLPLTWGSSMGFLFVLFSPSLHPHPCLSLVFHLLCTFLSPFLLRPYRCSRGAAWEEV